MNLLVSVKIQEVQSSKLVHVKQPVWLHVTQLYVYVLSSKDKNSFYKHDELVCPESQVLHTVALEQSEQNGGH